MCISRIESRPEADGSSWYPCRAECSEDCNDVPALLSYLASFLHKQISASICAETVRPVLEENQPHRYARFCEVQRILQDSSTSKTAKIKLISAPSLNRVTKFLTDLFEICGATGEIIIYVLVLLKRLLTTTGWKIRAASWRSMVICALRLALKVEEMPMVSAHSMHRVYPLFTPREFVNMENTFLKLVDYRIVVSQKEFSQQTRDIAEKIF